MADDFDFTPGIGAKGAADLISSVYYPRVKQVTGPDGTNRGDVSHENPFPITLGQGLKVAALTTTRPANVTQYTVGDVLGDLASASMTPMLFQNFARFNDVGGVLTGFTVRKSGLTAPTDAIFRLHIFNSQPTFTGGGDNSPFATVCSGTGYIGSLTSQYMKLFNDCAIGQGTPTDRNPLDFMPSSGGRDLWGVPELLGAYTPGSAEQFVFTLFGR